jgi:predicted nucleotidyltransferase component of viral defense system
VEKAVRLASFLGRMAGHPFLGGRLVLKGGTALNVYHLDLPRLSVDADLNYIGHIDAEGMEAERAQVFRNLEAVATELGYAPRIERDEYALRTYQLPYTGANGNNDHILLDVNFLERMPVLPAIERRPPPASLEVEGVTVPCLTLLELAGSKLATLLLRGACRDLFDVAALTQRKDVDWAFARKIALYHGFAADVGLATMQLERVAGVTQAAYDRDLRNLFRKGQEVSLEALKDAATPQAEAVLRLDAGEVACREALMGGKWQPELLFGDLAVHPELARSPPVEWRLKNPRGRR